jgi:radical SAM-linked protein
VVDRGFLWREWERALAAATSPDCRWEACLDCGACDGGLAPDPAVGATSDPATLEVRTPTVTAAAATVAEPSGGRWILTYAVHGPARFLGHLDTAEAVRRSVRRAGGRLATSRGMRPKPRLAIALPRPVGVSGAAELVEFTLAESPGSGFVRRLEASLPPGFGLVSLERTEEAKPVAARVIGARYRVVATGSDADGITPEELADGAGRYTRLPEIMVERVRAGGTKTFDVRSFVSGLEVRSVGDGVGVPSAEIEVEFETAVTPEGTARPEDVVTALGRLLGRSLTPVSAERLAIILRSSNHEGIEGA